MPMPPARQAEAGSRQPVFSLRSQCVSYRCAAAAGVEEEVGSVRGDGRLVGDWPVTQRHANDGRHVCLRAKDVDGDPGGLA